MKIGLALGAGAVRGLAHLGVLDVFMEEGIKIHCVAGSSIGALVGGFFCAGLDIKTMIRLATNLSWEHITEITLPRSGLIKGEKYLQFLRLLSQGRRIEDLTVQFTATAVDLERGEEVVIKAGPLAEAIRASTSIPGIYNPFYYQGRLLVDGGLLNRVPCQQVREMGADYVIAVNIEFSGNNLKFRNIYDVIVKSYELMEKEILKNRIMNADLVITPDVGRIPALQLRWAKECIKQGREAAWRIVSEVKAIK